MELSKYDKVSVRFYWDNPMTIDQMTDLVYDFLVGLEAISPALSGWCNLGKSRKDALSKKIRNIPGVYKKPISLAVYTNDLKGLFTALCIFEYENTDLFDKETLL